jgi:hypothetical protein
MFGAMAVKHNCIRTYNLRATVMFLSPSINNYCFIKSSIFLKTSESKWYVPHQTMAHVALQLNHSQGQNGLLWLWSNRVTWFLMAWQKFQYNMWNASNIVRKTHIHMDVWKHKVVFPLIVTKMNTITKKYKYYISDKQKAWRKKTKLKRRNEKQGKKKDKWQI